MTEKTLTPLATQLATIQDQIRLLTEQADSIKARILDVTDGPDRYAAGPLTILITANRRFNTTKFEEDHPLDENPHLYKIVLNAEAAKNSTPPNIYNQYMDDTGTNRITIK